MRYLGVDTGTKRIGLALGDADSGIVSPVAILQAVGDTVQQARAILDVADAYGADDIVVGLPLNMDGSAGPQARLAQRLADTIKAEGQRAVHLHDERLTSHAAEGRLSERGLTRAKKKARQDAVAAQILLESFLAREDGNSADNSQG